MQQVKLLENDETPSNECGYTDVHKFVNTLKNCEKTNFMRLHLNTNSLTKNQTNLKIY